MAEALMATGVSPTNRTGFPQFFKEVSAVMEKTSSFRRFGSAALDLAYVAAGRFEGFWEGRLNSWDVAAGVVLVREAGGFVTEYSGADFTPDSVSLIAGNASLHKSLTATLATTR
jgi:myo-inositol-1(or 4)-monophosphatase